MKERASSLSLAELASALAPAGARLVGTSDVGAEQVRIHHVGEDSRTLVPGSLFVARRGEHFDGTRFVEAAVAAGAVAVLTEPGSGVTFEPRIEAPNLALAFGWAAQELAGRPSEHLAVVGITGTNGKTTTTSLVDQALRTLGIPAARLGTLGFFIGDELIFETLTTPAPERLATALALAVERGVRVLIMEVSSHALAQERVAGVRFEVAAFTNLSQDHLDYHKTLEAYGETKARLFLDYAPRHSVLLVDDAYGAGLAARLPQALTVSRGTQLEATVVAQHVSLDARGVRADLSLGSSSFSLESRLVGLHNLENLLVAFGILTALGVGPDRATRALSEAESVPGRLERCDSEGDDLLALVDYAHTPDALSRVLAALRALSPQPIVCVFGCGGDRDRKKRAPMAQAVSAGAEIVWLTSDNPRTEDPEQILADARAGLAGSGRELHEEPERARAIRRAILEAPSGATVLIAGKGHETYQLIGGQTLPFDDRVETRRALQERRHLRQGRAS